VDFEGSGAERSKSRSLRIPEAACGVALLDDLPEPRCLLSDPIAGGRPKDSLYRAAKRDELQCAILAISPSKGLAGHPTKETIIANPCRLFLPLGSREIVPDLAKHVPELRTIIREQGYGKAMDFLLGKAREQGFPGLIWTDPFHPGFFLTIRMPHEGDVRDYVRTQDFATGEVAVRWRDDAGAWQRRLFVSSQPGVLDLLPALPASMPKGTLRGILARGQIRLGSLEWDTAAGGDAADAAIGWVTRKTHVPPPHNEFGNRPFRMWAAVATRVLTEDRLKAGLRTEVDDKWSYEDKDPRVKATTRPPSTPSSPPTTDTIGPVPDGRDRT